MKEIRYPSRAVWPEILARPAFDNSALIEKVSSVLEAVRKEGDLAVNRFTESFDGIILNEMQATASEMEEAAAILPVDLKQAIELAARNIRIFHEQQVAAVQKIETMPGVSCWRKSVGIERVGLYIPGGTAPLFSTILMLGIPAQIADCKEVILCSPPNKEGELHPAILFAARLVGIQKIYKIGGVQAIAAMAYGTETVPQVFKIFGPGNQYVTCAKQLIQQQGIAIDMPAGPSEVCVLADATAKASFVAADLLSQAEHGADSQVLLVTDSESLVAEVQIELEKQLNELSRKDLAFKSLNNSTCILIKNMEEGIELVNAYAAEHLIMACSDAELLSEGVINAGSIFLGNYSPESVGDYASGTNHTLPTNGFARAYSGVSVDSFVKKISFQQLSAEGLAGIAKTVELMAMAEGLDAHANAVRIRLAK
ncbi:MAG: histidinol dehydrogenase [Chitinophagaceae bacterium]|nr:histidinol dehydrogenase [Chitinophagaceae bacterium]